LKFFIISYVNSLKRRCFIFLNPVKNPMFTRAIFIQPDSELVSNLKEISSSVFSWKKRIYKKLRCNSTVKIWFSRKKILNYAYVLKNGVQFSLYRASLQSLSLFVLISSRISDLSVILTKYHYIILTDYPGTLQRGPIKGKL
jgi:hypothetical protein